MEWYESEIDWVALGGHHMIMASTTSPTDTTTFTTSTRPTVSTRLLEAAEHSVTWRGTDRQGRLVASGTYFARLTKSGNSVTRPMMLVR